ncbi:hypothetical protein C0991_007906 [Blastosporella zonata]|nr:hypothetical protein C0991_007906 [Blastosporella zonata]
MDHVYINNSLSAEDVQTLEEKIRNAPTFVTETPKDCFSSVEDGLVLLRSNIQPSQHQAQTLKRILDEKTLDLELVEADALRLQLKINKMMLKMKEIDALRMQRGEDANFYKYMLSTVRLLPPEVLVNIFTYLVEISCPTRRARSPIGISHVCRAWRSAVIGCSSFWPELVLHPCDVSSVDDRAPRIYDSLIPTWFNRARRSRPLALKMFCFNHARCPIDAGDLLHGVVSVAPRLTELLLRFDWKDHTFILPLLSSPPETFPFLEKLTLIEERGGEANDPITIFGASPRLRELTLHVCSPRVVNGDRLLLPWAQLTYLNLAQAVTFQVLAKVLFQCPQIDTLCVPHVDLENTDPIDLIVPPHPMSFPNLTVFKLGIFGAERSDEAINLDVLTNIYLPKVETLELSAGPQLDHVLFPLFTMVGGISASFSSIRRLLLSHVDTSLAELPLLLHGCVNLESLALYLPELDPQQILLWLTTSSGTDGPIHSKLTSFTFAFHAATIPITANYLDDVGRRFSELCEIWLKDPMRNRPLETLSLFVCDFNIIVAHTDTIHATFNDIRDRLSKLACLFKGSFVAKIIHDTNDLLSSMRISDEYQYFPDEYVCDHFPLETGII